MAVFNAIEWENQTRAEVARGGKVAVQCSGGKDSLALVWYLRDCWEHLTVYWLNTGDAMPETLTTIDSVRAQVPHFVEVSSPVAECHEKHGLPAHIVPAECCSTAQAITVETPHVQAFYDCCYHTIMWPMHGRMILDGVTLVLRGQKKVDTLRSRSVSGMSHGSMSVQFPIDDWTDDEVLAYVAASGFPLPAFYAAGVGGGDCATCPAYTNENRAGYLAKVHPILFLEHQRKRAAVAEMLIPALEAQMKEYV